MFFGRDDIFDWVQRNLTGQYADHILVLHGQRRVGKTSVLKQLPHRLPPRYIPVFFDLQGRTHTTLDRFLWWLAREIVRVLKQDREITVALPEKESFAHDLEFLETHFLPDLRPYLGGNNLLLTFDEFDTLEEPEIREVLGRPLTDYFRRLMGREGLNFIFSIGSSGRKLENMQASYTEFFKAALYKKVSFLNREDAFRLITRPVEGLIEYDRDAVQSIFRIASGHPYFTQLVCHELFALCQETGTRAIHRAEVESVLDDVVERGTVNLKFVWDEAADLEKWCLASTAHLEGKAGVRDLADLLRRQRVRFSEADLESALLHLRQKDVLTEDNQFVIHLMRIWLQKNRPLQQVREELTEINPIANRYVEIGLNFQDSGQHEKAIESFREALGVDPDNVAAQVNIATVLLQQQAHAEAIIEFERALAIDDEDIAARAGLCEANLALGDQSLGRGKAKDALRSYEKVLAINAEHTEARQRMADIFRQQAEKALSDGRAEEALAAFQRALGYTPEDERLEARHEEVRKEQRAKMLEELISRAARELAARSWNQGAALLEQALELAPEDESIRQRLAKLREQQREDQSHALRARAEQALGQGRWAEAISALEETLSAEPENAEAPALLAQARERQRQDSLAAQRKRAEALVAAESWDEAFAAWEAYLALEPEDAEAAKEEKARVAEERAVAQTYAEAQQAMAAKDFDGAIRLLKGIVLRDEMYKDASRFMAQAIEMRRKVRPAMPVKPFPKWARTVVLAGLAVAALCGVGLVAWKAGALEALGSLLPSRAADEMPGAGFRACLVTDENGVDDQYLQAAAWEGIEKAAAELGVDGRYLASRDEAAIEENVRKFVQQDCDVIITVGRDMAETALRLASQYPDQKFLLIDGYHVQRLNTLIVTYEIEEAAYLAGYLAAATSETGKVGTFGWWPDDAVKDAMDAFAQGVESYNGGHTRQVILFGWDRGSRTGSFVGDLRDEAKHRVMAEDLIAKGADVLFVVSPPWGGLAAAAVAQEQAEEQQVQVIGFDVDWAALAPEYGDVILTSAVKDVAGWTGEMIDRIVREGPSLFGTVLKGDLEADGVGLAPVGEWASRFPDELTAELERLRQAIIAEGIPAPGAVIGSKICLLTDPDGIAAGPFNLGAWEAVQSMAQDVQGTAMVLEPTSDADIQPNLDKLVEEGCDLIVTVAFRTLEATQAAAEAHPEQKFAIVDFEYDPPLPNVLGQRYEVGQAAFLAGYLAAGVTQTGKVGAMGGAQIPPVTRFLDGYAAGVQYYNDRHATAVELLGWDLEQEQGLFVGDFVSEEPHRAAAESLMDLGADVILVVSSHQAGLGVAESAKERGGVYLIGVDSDWNALSPGYEHVFLTSVVKVIDVVTSMTIQDALQGNFGSGVMLGTLENGGVDLAPLQGPEGLVSEELRAEIEETRQLFVSGGLSLETAPLSWSPIGSTEAFPSDFVTQLVVDPADPSHLFAGTATSGIYRSLDGGSTWSAASEGLEGGEVDGLAIDPTDPRTMYATMTGGGLHKSTDGGDHWTQLQVPGADNPFRNRLVMHPQDAARLYYSPGSGLYRTDDGGDSWTEIGPDACPTDMQSLAIERTVGDVLLFSQNARTTGCEAGVHASFDGGETWELLGLQGDPEYVQLAVGAGAEVLYASEWDRLHVSYDRGRTWWAPRDDCGRVLWADPAEPGFAYCDSWVTHDGGRTWRSGPAPADISSIVLLPDSERRLLMAGNGVFASKFGGVSEPERVGAPGLAFTELALLEDSFGDILFAAAQPRHSVFDFFDCRLFSSISAGAEWVPFAESGPQCVSIVSGEHSAYYRYDRSSALRSQDGGDTWSALALPEESVWLQANPYVPGMLFAAAEYSPKIYRSTDYGDTWEETCCFLKPEHYALFFADKDGTRTYAVGLKEMLFSEDYGMTWKNCAHDYGETAQTASRMVISPNDPNRLFIATRNEGILRGSDGCGLWQAVNTGLGSLVVNSLAVDPQAPDTLYAGTAAGAFVTSDGGEQWYPINQGLGGTPAVYSIVVDQNDPRAVYAATSNGIFRLEGR